MGDLQLPPGPHGSDPAWNLYVVRTERRDELAASVADAGVQTGIHYVRPIHLSPVYTSLGRGAGSFPVAERLAHEVLSLPLFPDLAMFEQETVVGTIKRFFNGA